MNPINYYDVWTGFYGSGYLFLRIYRLRYNRYHWRGSDQSEKIYTTGHYQQFDYSFNSVRYIVHHVDPHR